MSAVEETVTQHSYLAENGVVSDADLRRLNILWRGESTPLSLPEFIVGMGAAAELAVFRAVAEHAELPLLRATEFEEVDGLAEKISENFLQSHRVVPCGLEGNTLTIAVSDPGNVFVSKSIALASGQLVKMVIGLPSEIESAIEGFFGEGRSQIERITAESTGEDDELVGVEAEKLRDMASEAPVVKLVNVIFGKAQTTKASDIHLEPFEDELKLRFRVDGVLVDVEAPPRSMAAAVISRLKLMAGLNIAERRLPQDGRIRLQQSGKEFDVRVSTVPTVHGESVVMRLLDRADVDLSLESLGFEEDAASMLRSGLRQPHGMILVTGPTGSGKTTTLYAALQLLNSPDRKVMTIEDPVEYQLNGINQIQIQPSIGLTFASALRAIVRQDPDIIMVGELRDKETASICVQSALTGHLVLSTVHTNNAADAITRLLDMGVESYLLPSTLNLIVAQRLVRRLCVECKRATEISTQCAEFFETIGKTDISSAHIFDAVGCDACSRSGFNGRIAIAEILPVNERIRSLIVPNANADDIKRAALENGMRTLTEDGARKVLLGETTLEEVFRITRAAS